jgi:hypothetical protein
MTNGGRCPVHPEKYVYATFDNHAVNFIPHGEYCYSYTGRVLINDKVIDGSGEIVSVDYYLMPETKICPFWNRIEEGGAICTFTRQISEYGDFHNLIWDQVKECGKNTTPEAVNEPLEPNYPVEIKIAREQAKLSPTFIHNLVNMLVAANYNQITCDSVTYTLNPQIRNKLKNESTVL